MKNMLNNDAQDLGYEFLDTVELQGEEWSFYLLGVWAKDGNYYLATDSGCSCPSPFENHQVEDLTGPLTANQAIEEATSLWNDSNKFDPEGFQDLMKSIK